eukprot:gene6246-biopygen6289
MAAAPGLAAAPAGSGEDGGERGGHRSVRPQPPLRSANRHGPRRTRRVPGLRRLAEGGRGRGGRAAVPRRAAVVQAVRCVGGRRRVALAQNQVRSTQAQV